MAGHRGRSAVTGRSRGLPEVLITRRGVIPVKGVIGRPPWLPEGVSARMGWVDERWEELGDGGCRVETPGGRTAEIRSAGSGGVGEWEAVLCDRMGREFQRWALPELGAARSVAAHSLAVLEPGG